MLVCYMLPVDTLNNIFNHCFVFLSLPFATKWLKQIYEDIESGEDSATLDSSPGVHLSHLVGKQRRPSNHKHGVLLVHLHCSV